MKDPVDRARVFQLFDEALGRPVETRQGWLEQACVAEPGVLEAVLDLLADERGAETTGRESTGCAPELPEIVVRHVFGRFRVLERIGRGGMGSVFRAERIDGLEQRVALKLLPADRLGQPARIVFGSYATGPRLIVCRMCPSRWLLWTGEVGRLIGISWKFGPPSRLSCVSVYENSRP